MTDFSGYDSYITRTPHEGIEASEDKLDDEDTTYDQQKDERPEDPEIPC